MPSTDYAGEELAPAPSVYTAAQADPGDVPSTDNKIVETQLVVTSSNAFNSGFELI